MRDSRVFLFSALFSGLELFGCRASDTPREDGGGGQGGGEVEPVHMDPEAGFIETDIGLNTKSRIFYSFIPADEHPESAPVLVYFNGGPGAATTGVLAPYGTGPFTLDPASELEDPPVANDSSHTRFANLLYIDAPATGYSYDMGAPRCDEAPTIRDAGSFIAVVLDFLDHHQPLVDNRVVFVGESYGGTRAVLMQYMLQHYTGAELLTGAPDFLPQVPWLKDRMRAHLQLARGEATDLSPAGVAEQFGHQILVQPNIFGLEQVDYQRAFIEQDPLLAPYLNDPMRDSYDVRRSAEEGARLLQHSARAMRDPEMFETLFRVRMTDIPLIGAQDRREVVRVAGANYDFTEIFEQERVLRDTLGNIGALDAYWLPLVMPCGLYVGNFETLTAFVDVLARTDTFITNARYDTVVYSSALAYFVDEVSDMPGEIDETAPSNSERPGQMRIGDNTRMIRFPSYDSGHEVSIGAPREFAADVEQWLQDTGALPD